MKKEFGRCKEHGLTVLYVTRTASGHRNARCRKCKNAATMLYNATKGRESHRRSQNLYRKKNRDALNAKRRARYAKRGSTERLHRIRRYAEQNGLIGPKLTPDQAWNVRRILEGLAA